MDNEILFSEQQKFRQWWLWLLLLVIDGRVFFQVYKLIIGGQQLADNPSILISAVIVLCTSILFLSFRLETTVKNDGIYVRFFPFHIKFRYYSWDKISQLYVRQYNPIGEYGGWGFRLGLFGKGRALNVSGDKGLQLEFTDKKKLLIGTNNPEELKDALREIGKLTKE